MEILICIFLLIVATVTSDTVTAVGIGSSAVTQNHITPPEYSKVNQEVYKAHATPVTPITPKTLTYTAPPLPILPPITYKTAPTPSYIPPPTKTLSKEAYSKPEPIKPAPPPPVIHKPTPLVKKIIEEITPIPFQIYSVPKSIVQTYSAPIENEDKGTGAYKKEYSDPEGGPAEYQPEEYPAVPIGPTYVPPIAVYNAYPPVFRRGYFTPAYDNRVYPRVYNIAPPFYRTLGYGGPTAYTVPSIRSFAYGYPSQPGYGPFNIAYDNGIPEIRYNGFINSDYDGYLKKKK